MILGVDVSEYQGEMDWQKCKQAGAQFAYFRVGYGPDGMDDQLERNCELAPQVLPTGGYWVFHPDWPAAGQADLFADLLSGWEWKLRPWVDVELKGAVSKAIRTNRLEEFLLRLTDRLRTLPVVYTRAEWFNTNISQHLLWPCCDLAVARYCNLAHPWDDGSCVPRDWDDWLFWQWSADGNGRGAEFGAQSDSIDLDWYQGALYEPVEKRVTLKYAAWMKDRPATRAAAVAAAWRGVELEQAGEQGDWVKVAGWLPKGAVSDELLTKRMGRG